MVIKACFLHLNFCFLYILFVSLTMAVLKSVLVLLSVAAGAIAQQSAYGQCETHKIGEDFGY